MSASLGSLNLEQLAPGANSNIGTPLPPNPFPPSHSGAVDGVISYFIPVSDMAYFQYLVVVVAQRLRYPPSLPNPVFATAWLRLCYLPLVVFSVFCLVLPTTL
uniref:Uncharacterized protein n=1 Tax=Timema cristinae TaxID=61476 RepID=A0A7R9DBJ1_TIMCR|nr:unnamed protein product [Timema cristinae]